MAEWEPEDPLLVKLHDARLDQMRAKALTSLIRYLYVDLEQSMGGPLHVQLDDGNLGDYWVGEVANRDRFNYLWNGDFERWSEAGDDVSEQRKQAIQTTCEKILELLRPMSEQQRSEVCNRAWKEIHP